MTSPSPAATDTANSGITGAAVVNVQAAAADHFEVDAPAAVTSGMAFDLTVLALDPYGNADTNYAGTVTFATSDPDPGAVLPPDYTFTAGDQGVHTFAGGATFRTVGVQTVLVSDGTDGLVPDFADVNVTPAPVSQLVVDGFATSTTAGIAHSFTVTAYDSYGNVATNYTGTVHFSSTDPLAALPGDASFTPANNGVASFAAALRTAGSNQAITATDLADHSVTGTESGIQVTAAASGS